MTRKYSTISVQTTLAVGISSTATTMTVATGTAAGLVSEALAAGNVDQFAIAIDHDTVNEEIVWVTGVSVDTLTVVRGRAGTSNVAHSAGASVKHVLTGEDLTYFTTQIGNAVLLTGAQSITGTKTFTSPVLTTPSISTIINTGTITLPTSTDTLVARATTDTLTNKTLTTPKEKTTVSATAATGTIAFDAATQAVLYYTTNSSANWTLNIRGNSSTTLNSIMSVGDALTVTFLATNGSTAYYQTGFQIDGSAVTPKWQNGSPPALGNPSSIDAYSYSIIKTASTPTYTVIASQTRFA